MARSGQLLLRFLTAPTIVQRRDRRIYASSAPAPGAESRAAQWRLLSQIDSDDEAEIEWEGGGLVYYCIQEETLQAGEFGDVWLTMQFL